MNPGVVILHLTKGRLSHRYSLDLQYPVHAPRDFEWMYKTDKITWLEGLYRESTEETPQAHHVICTTRDLFDYLYKQQNKNETPKVMVVAILHGDDEVIDTTQFYI